MSKITIYTLAITEDGLTECKAHTTERDRDAQMERVLREIATDTINHDPDDCARLIALLDTGDLDAAYDYFDEQISMGDTVLSRDESEIELPNASVHVVVKGGCVQQVLTRGGVDVDVMDFDNGVPGLHELLASLEKTHTDTAF